MLTTLVVKFSERCLIAHVDISEGEIVTFLRAMNSMSPKDLGCPKCFCHCF